MITVLIVDDEPLARQELRNFLEAELDIQIVDECSNAIEAIKIIHEKKIDVAFLDIQMPRVSGMELVSMLDPERKPQIVFLTAHDEYAVSAFEAQAFDYLLKPIDPKRLQTTLQHIRVGVKKPAAHGPLQETAQLRHIPCVGINRILLLKCDDVECVISKTSGVYVVSVDGKEHFTELTLKTLEEKTTLIRCHKQFLINADQIKEIRFAENGLAEILTLGDRSVPVSRRFLGSLKDNVGIV